MSTERRVLVHPDKAALAASVAATFMTTMREILHEDSNANANVILTGGSVGIAVLEAINASATRDSIDWSRVDFWWGDERWVARDHPDRNEKQARSALLDHIEVPSTNIHSFAASGEELTLGEAAQHYAADLAACADDDGVLPHFEIAFLGVGPDGHVASLFPHGAGIREEAASVICIRTSPKPPPERLSLTRPVLNSSDRVWMVLAGSDKASALGLALAGASRDEVPAAGIKGRKHTVFFVDSAAAAEVPESLLTPSE